MDREDLIASLRESIDAISATQAKSTSGKQTDGRSSSVEMGDRQRGAGAESEADEALARIAALVNASDKSEHAIRQRLEQKGFTSCAIDEAVERAKRYGYIDDLRYADVLARSRISQGKGIAGIERELRSQGIEPDLLDGWPEAYGVDDSSEVERALELLKRKPPTSKNVREGAYRRLVGKGFSSPVASSAARIYAEDSRLDR